MEDEKKTLKAHDFLHDLRVGGFEKAPHCKSSLGMVTKCVSEKPRPAEKK